MSRKIHLLCNAHLDPVWHWEWEEGASAAISTFRAAAEMCEENDTFIFCHNEAMLYQWIEEYEPSLFGRIQKLVKAGKWQIVGGWYLQPDCNMPSGESFINQIRTGKRYFSEKFGVDPKIAVNFDSFGHTHGLVQIMKKAGYEGYLFMRPMSNYMDLPDPDFIWVGSDGSEIAAHRLTTMYGTPGFGMARKALEEWMAKYPDMETGLFTWGVGNHGGGPSRKDITEIGELMQTSDADIRHSTAEAYFNDVKASGRQMPRVEGDLHPFSVGCYTSQIRVKQTHRRLEAAISSTQRICTHAYIAAGMKYPKAEIDEAMTDLMFAEFHDILPGTSIQPVEQMALRRMDHGLDILNRLHARAFFALSACETKAAPGMTPVLIYNPHPYPLEGDWMCEFNLMEPVRGDAFVNLKVFDTDGSELPAQVEKEESNMPLEWRKRVVFHATLKPCAINRFDCAMDILESKPVPRIEESRGRYVFDNKKMRVEIDRKTGYIVFYAVNGHTFINRPVRPLVMLDDEETWGMRVDRFRDVEGAMEALTPEACAELCAVNAPIESVRVVENGPVRTVVEAALGRNASRMVLRYILPVYGSAIDIQARVFWFERHKMLKLALPTVLNGKYLGETAFGVSTLFANGQECVSQRWSAVSDDARGAALSVINDSTYGSDFSGGEIRISMLRGAGYLAHPVLDKTILPQDRYSPHMEQGERTYNFRIEGGDNAAILDSATGKAMEFNEKPYALSFFPNGHEPGKYGSLAELTPGTAVLSLLRPADDGLLVRLYNPSGKTQRTRLTIDAAGLSGADIELKPHEILTLKVKDGKAVPAYILD